MATESTVNFEGNALETTVTDKASAIDHWLSTVRSTYCYQPNIIVGLDCEWKPHFIRSMSNKTATLQICIGKKCLIVQMFYLDYIPRSLRSFFAYCNLTFVGVEVQDEVSKLLVEYGLRVAKTADIQALAMARWPRRFFQEAWIEKLASSVAGLNMLKPLHVCRSNWEARHLIKC